MSGPQGSEWSNSEWQGSGDCLTESDWSKQDRMKAFCPGPGGSWTDVV